MADGSFGEDVISSRSHGVRNSDVSMVEGTIIHRMTLDRMRGGGLADERARMAAGRLIEEERCTRCTYAKGMLASQEQR